MFAQAALSNMVGGIGYFYGASSVQSIYTSEPVNYWRAPLFTAVPSRYFTLILIYFKSQIFLILFININTKNFLNPSVMAPFIGVPNLKDPHT